METKIKYGVVLIICLLMFGAERCALGTDPLAHWRFDEADGNTAYDSAGMMHGTVYGAEWDLGVVGGALDFDGTDDFVEVPDSDVLDITSEITLSAWIKPASISGFKHIVSKWGVGIINCSYGFNLDDGLVRVFLVNGGYKTAKSYTDLSVSQNEWNYVAATWDGQTMRAYLNGIVSDQNESFTDTINVTDSLVAIGYNSGHGGGVGGDYFNGTIDDVQMYNVALTDVEIRQLFEGGSTRTVAVDIKPGSCPNPLNLGSRGVLPVAVLGSAEFDVNEIDIASIRLLGVSPVRSSFEDVASPVADGNVCDCTDSDGDGYMDLTLKFKTTEIVEALIGIINDLAKGDQVALKLTGVMIDQTPLEGEDCVVIVGKVPQSLRARKSDINEDGIVNIHDFSVMTSNWLVHTHRN